LEDILQDRFDVIHIVGGGGRNELLNQLTADALNRRVMVGPAEATAIGNGLVQAMALGYVQDLTDLRRRVAMSESLREFTPQNPAVWEDIRVND
jgi:rhamnulokinase